MMCRLDLELGFTNSLGPGKYERMSMKLTRREVNTVQTAGDAWQHFTLLSNIWQTHINSPRTLHLFLSLSLPTHWTPTSKAGLENVQTFLFPGFVPLFYQYLCNIQVLFFLLLIWAPQDAALNVCSLPMKRRKTLAHDATDILRHTCRPRSSHAQHTDCSSPMVLVLFVLALVLFVAMKEKPDTVGVVSYTQN